jgi:transcriptional regulator with XRE-family HTH domain
MPPQTQLISDEQMDNAVAHLRGLLEGGENQTTLSRKCGVSQPLISRIFSRQVRRPTLKTLRKLAGALGTDLEEITQTPVPGIGGHGTSATQETERVEQRGADDVRLASNPAIRDVFASRLPDTELMPPRQEDSLSSLLRAWETPQKNVMSIVGWGGCGKTALVKRLLGHLAARSYRRAQLVFCWSFRNAASAGEVSSDSFFQAALSWFRNHVPACVNSEPKGVALARLIRQTRTLLILDALDTYQAPPGPSEGQLADPALRELLLELAAFNPGLCVVTSRIAIPELSSFGETALQLTLEALDADEGAEVLRRSGLTETNERLFRLTEELHGHNLSLWTAARFLRDMRAAEMSNPIREAFACGEGKELKELMTSYENWLSPEGEPNEELALLRTLSLFEVPASMGDLQLFRAGSPIEGLNRPFVGLDDFRWARLLSRLERTRLISLRQGARDANSESLLVSTPAFVREYFREKLLRDDPNAWRRAQAILLDRHENTLLR